MEIPIKIIQASKSDLPEIGALQTSSFPAEKQQLSHILEESIRKCADTFLLARDENQLLGYILSSPQSDNPQCLKVHSLVIESDHQRQGLGTLLLAALKEVAVELDYKGIRLESPDELLSYFEMNGFVDEPGGYISVTCLSIAKEAQGLGLGQKLLTALKEVALEDERDGINLTCHDYLIAYYEKHGFVNEGQSQSTFAGETWYDMVWEMKK
ncbi:GNAT family acetyltransferase [Streptococcus pneumoniae]|nr:GNAT family acetyltransferase [Streptococcus pneumoniae]